MGKNWRAVIIFILIFFGVILVGRLPVFQIKTVELTGDSDPTVGSALDNLQGQPLFSHAVTGLIDTTRQNLNVADFDCRRGLPNALRCNLKLRTPALIWQSGDSTYLVDQQGLLYGAKTAEVTGVITVTDQSKMPIKVGSQIVSEEIINQYNQLISLLKAQSLNVISLQLGETLYQITAIIDRPGKTPVQAIFLLTGNLSDQVLSVATTLTQKGDSITTYVDARVSGYIYTK